ncbi:MAG: hypothetical protein ACI9Y1_000667 [Lentisphaeria bacterium]
MLEFFLKATPNIYSNGEDSANNSRVFCPILRDTLAILEQKHLSINEEKDQDFEDNSEKSNAHRQLTVRDGRGCSWIEKSAASGDKQWYFDGCKNQGDLDFTYQNKYCSLPSFEKRKQNRPEKYRCAPKADRLES